MTVAFIILGVYLAVIFIAPVVLMAVFCDRHVHYKKEYTATEFGLGEPENMFLTTADGLRINVRLVLPQSGGVKAIIVIASGIDGPTITSFYGYAKRFCRMGYACFLPELRAHGASEGNRVCLAYKETMDIRAVVEYARKRFPGYPVDLMGLSMGAGTVLRAMGEDPSIRAVVSFSAFSTIPDFFFGQARKYLTPVLAYPLRPISQLLCRIKFGPGSETEAREKKPGEKEPGEKEPGEIASATPLDAVRSLSGRPVLFVHSTRDSVVPFLCFERLTAEAVKHSDRVRTFVIEADRHLITTDPHNPEKDAGLWRALTEFLQQL